MSARLAGSVPPASLLSGGLDSSSIVALSAKLLKAQNKTLDVFSAVVDSDVSSEYPDERYFIDQFKSDAGVSINYVSAGGLGPFSNLSELFEKHDSPFVTSRHYLYRSLIAAAQEKGARTLFDGAFGEFGATAHTFGGFAEMFAGLNWLTLFRELRQRSRRYNESFMYNLRANTISPNIPRFLVDLRRGAKSGSQRLNQFSFLDPYFCKQLLANCKYKDPGFSGELPDHNQNQVNSLEFLQAKMSEMVSRSFDNPDIELRYPLLDKRIVEFTLSVPLRLKMRDGFYRYLIRASLDGILPEKIQWRTSKTSFSPDYRQRFRIQIGDVRDLLREVRKGDPIREFIDIDKLIRWSDLDYFDDSVYQQNEIIALDHLPQAIYLIYFLRTFPEFRN
jgi:asparagine synthase (glutamine-hydrolysing)